MRHLATTSIAAGKPLDWYEQLYADAEHVPWDHGEPTPFLSDWLERFLEHGHRGNAIIVGCAFGDDAELTARHGFNTTAFDISPSVIIQAQQRNAGTCRTGACAHARRVAVASGVHPPLGRDESCHDVAPV